MRSLSPRYKFKGQEKQKQKIKANVGDFYQGSSVILVAIPMESHPLRQPSGEAQEFDMGRRPK